MQQTFARAKFPFAATQAGDLSFEEDEVIVVLEQNSNGWWNGKIGNRTGDFPFNYVEVISVEEYMKRLNLSAGKQFAQKTSHSVSSIVVTPDKENNKFLVRVETSAGITEQAVKHLSDFRQLDSLIKAIFPQFDTALPPAWADNAYFSETSAKRRATVLEAYLKHLDEDAMEYALVSWVNARTSFTPSEAARMQVEGGKREAAAIQRNSIMVNIKRAPILARVEYNWQPHDAVELELVKGEVIAVISRQTQSPGWWEGETAEGLVGLFPYNHVTPLLENEATALIRGKYNDKVAATPVPRVKSKPKPVKNARARKTETSFAIASMESFDALLLDGFTLEKNGEIYNENNSNAPSSGDTCTMEYIGYVWDCQKQQIVEFASSDLPDKEGSIANMVFTIGNGEVIKGIELAAGFMSQGESLRLIVQPDYAYGDVGFPQLNIPPNIHLVYDLKLISFDSSVPAAPTLAQTSNALDARVPATYEEAIGMNARKAGTQQKFIPVGNRHARGGPGGNTHLGVKHMPKPAAAQQPPMGGGGAPSGGGKKQKVKKAKQYDLMKMREIVRKKDFTTYGVQAAFLEESLTDRAFEEAFHCERSAFILMPRWKQMKMKKEADLF